MLKDSLEKAKLADFTGNTLGLYVEKAAGGLCPGGLDPALPYGTGINPGQFRVTANSPFWPPCVQVPCRCLHVGADVLELAVHA